MQSSWATTFTGQYVRAVVHWLKWSKARRITMTMKSMITPRKGIRIYLITISVKNDAPQRRRCSPFVRKPGCKWLFWKGDVLFIDTFRNWYLASHLESASRTNLFFIALNLMYLALQLIVFGESRSTFSFILIKILFYPILRSNSMI